MHVRDIDQAVFWLTEYAVWEARWDQFLRHRTYPRAHTERPAGISEHQHWWYTHRDLRKTRGLYRTLIRNKQLFTWIDPELTDPGPPAPADHQLPRRRPEPGPQRPLPRPPRPAHRARPPGSGMETQQPHRHTPGPLEPGPPRTPQPTPPPAHPAPRRRATRTNPRHRIQLGRRQRHPARLGRPITPLTPTTHRQPYTHFGH